MILSVADNGEIIMKKFLIASSISLLITSSAFAADTYTGSFFEAQQKKLDAQTSKIVNKEKQIQAQKNAVTGYGQNQEAARKQQLEAQQRAQQELIDRKKKQIQATKDSLNQQKQDLKDIFSIK